MPNCCNSSPGPDPRQLQQLGRAVDAARDDDLALGKSRPGPLWRAVFDANRPAALEQDPRRMCLGCNSQVGAALGGAEVGARRTPAPAVGGRRLVIADPFLAG